MLSLLVQDQKHLLLEPREKPPAQRLMVKAPGAQQMEDRPWLQPLSPKPDYGFFPLQRDPHTLLTQPAPRALPDTISPP